jgi:hypothetical protein
MEAPAALIRALQPSTKLAKLIRWYIDSFEHISKCKLSCCSLKSTPLAKSMRYFWSLQCVDHIRSRRAKGAGPLQSPKLDDISTLDELS